MLQTSLHTYHEPRKFHYLFGSIHHKSNLIVSDHGLFAVDSYTFFQGKLYTYLLMSSHHYIIHFADYNPALLEEE